MIINLLRGVERPRPNAPEPRSIALFICASVIILSPSGWSVNRSPSNSDQARPSADVVQTQYMIERVSVSSQGAQAARDSSGSSVSDDGRFVAFGSWADNLVPNDTNGTEDIFVRDRQTGVTERVSVSSSGLQGNDQSLNAVISGNGRFVVFSSGASNLVLGDTNQAEDVFVRDMQNQQTTRVSVSSLGVQASSLSTQPDISPDGRFVVFQSSDQTLVSGLSGNGPFVFLRDRATDSTELVSRTSLGVPVTGTEPSVSGDGGFVAFVSGSAAFDSRDTNDEDDIYVWQRSNGSIRRVSVNSAGTEGILGGAWSPTLSADGRYVAFVSGAYGLGEVNSVADVFVHDLSTGETRPMSITFNGSQVAGHSDFPSISADGRYVLFYSVAGNLVNGDTDLIADIFVRDRALGVTERLSVPPAGGVGGAGPVSTGLSGDGRFVTFTSWSSDLVPGDTNEQPDVFLVTRSATPILNHFVFLAHIRR